jgi:lipid II:glycine glycyltransferase (peptidoglycan interpeptide bridge formation enzyme)
MINYVLITNANAIDKKKWSDFVYNHPNSNIFQTPEMCEVYQNSKKYEPVFLAVVNNQDEISGTLLAVIQKEYSGVLGNFTARSIIQGGPLIKDDDPDVLGFVLKEYDEIIKKKAIYSQFRNFWDWGYSREIFIKNGFEFEEHLNILIDLTKTEEQLWKEVYSKRRNEVRRATKEGVCFSIEHTEDSLKKCYGILQKVYSRAKLPIPDYNFFYNLYRMGSNSKLIIFCACYESKIIGCMLALSFKDTIHDFYAGSMVKFYNKYPNDLIPWEVFKWGKENNYKVFDFGGAGKPDVPYGVRDYKKKFGGAFVNYGRYEKIHKPLLMQIGKLGLKLWQKIK